MVAIIHHQGTAYRKFGKLEARVAQGTSRRCEGQDLNGLGQMSLFWSLSPALRVHPLIAAASPRGAALTPILGETSHYSTRLLTALFYTVKDRGLNCIMSKVCMVSERCWTHFPEGPGLSYV